MRVNSIQSHIKIYKNSNKEEINSNNFHKDFSNSIKKLPDYPVAYVKFAPSFGISLEEKLKKEELLKNEEMKQDYLWAISWDKDEAKKEYDLRAQKEIEIENQKKFFGNINDEKEYEIRRKYNNLYETDLKKYNNIMEHKDEYKQLVDKDLLTRHKSVTELIKMSRESLDKEIAGYSSLKRDMGRMFLEPIKRELITGVEEIENNVPKVANCILLCGPTGCGKTLAAETVAKETSCNIFKIPTNTRADAFPEEIRTLVAMAREIFETRTQAIQKLKESEEYNEMSDEEKLKALLKIGSPRTVILIDEFDKYFNDRIVDKRVIDGNKLLLKQVFDGCAEWPKPNSGKAAAVTFLCTTNYPSRIPEELEVGKCERVPVLPPSGQDMIDVIKHYMKQANALIDTYIKENPDLKKIDIENINLKKFVEYYAPNEKDGAFINDSIQYMILDAADSYIDNPQIDYNLHLIRTFNHYKRDITPKKYNIYLKELSLKGLDKKDEIIDRSILSEKEFLERKIEEMSELEDILPDKDLELLKQYKTRYQEIINEKGEKQ